MIPTISHSAPINPVAETRRRRSHTLERQAIGFTISLYLFICLGLIALHYAAPLLPSVEDSAGDCSGSSSTSPYNPC